MTQLAAIAEARREAHECERDEDWHAAEIVWERVLRLSTSKATSDLALVGIQNCQQIQEAYRTANRRKQKAIAFLEA